jgi:hypothetical protein
MQKQFRRGTKMKTDKNENSACPEGSKTAALEGKKEKSIQKSLKVIIKDGATGWLFFAVIPKEYTEMIWSLKRGTRFSYFERVRSFV